MMKGGHGQQISYMAPNNVYVCMCLHVCIKDSRMIFADIHDSPVYFYFNHAV